MRNLQKLQNIYTNTLVITENYLKNNYQANIPHEVLKRYTQQSNQPLSQKFGNIHQMNEAELLNKIEIMTQIMLPKKNTNIEYC